MDTTIYQKNDLAHSYIRASRHRDKFKDAFSPGDKILIYGCGMIGRAFYHDTKDDLDIIGFIDNNFSNTANGSEMDFHNPNFISAHVYEGLPVYSLKNDDEKLKKIAQNESLKVLVTPMWAWNAILKDIRNTVGQNVVVVSLYQVFAFAELDFCSTVSDNERNFLQKIKSTQRFPFMAVGRFPVKNKMYSLLLYLLYNKKFWKDTCFIFDSGFSSSVVSELREKGCVCFQDLPGSDEGTAFDSLLRFLVLYMPTGTKFYGEDSNFMGMKHFLNCDINIFEERWAKDYDVKERIDFMDIEAQYVTNGYDDRVKKLLVTEEIKLLPDALQKKAIRINVNDMWKQASQDERNDIMQIFSMSEQGILACWKWGYNPNGTRFFRENRLVSSLRLYTELVNHEQYEMKWENLKAKFKTIRIYKFECSVLGDSLQLFMGILHSVNLNEFGILNVFLPFVDHVANIHNMELMKLLKQKIYIPDSDEIPFWAYVYKMHPEELDLSRVDQFGYIGSLCASAYEVKAYQHEFEFSESQQQEGQRRMEIMGIHQRFACMMARSPKYYSSISGRQLQYDFRNMDFSDYGETIKCLKKRGIISVRMGRREGKMPFMDNCIDYAGCYDDDFMDIYLFSHCKMLICNCTGVLHFASLFHIPMLVINGAPIFMGFGGFQYTDTSIFMTQKYYDTYRKKYLSLREIFQIEKKCRLFGSRYKKMGIRFEKNTPKEICTATNELLDRLEGRWVDTELDKENYRRYKETYDELMQQPFSVPIPLRPSATYLRANPYLLE